MIAALHLAYGMNKSQILWFNQLVSHSPSIMYSLQGMLPLEDVPEMVYIIVLCTLSWIVQILTVGINFGHDHRSSTCMLLRR